MNYILPKKNDMLYVKDRTKCIAICSYHEKLSITDNEWWYLNENNFLKKQDVLIVLEVINNAMTKKIKLKCLFQKEVVYIKESEFNNLSLLK